MRSTPERLSPTECFKRGFYGGFGLWCSFMVLNFLVALILFFAIVWGGLISTAGIAWSKDKGSRGIQPPPNAVEPVAPQRTPARRR